MAPSTSILVQHPKAFFCVCIFLIAFRSIFAQCTRALHKLSHSLLNHWLSCTFYTGLIFTLEIGCLLFYGCVMKCWSCHLSLVSCLLLCFHQSTAGEKPLTTSLSNEMTDLNTYSYLDYLCLYVSITLLQWPKAISNRSTQLTGITSIKFKCTMLTLSMTSIWMSLLIVIPLNGICRFVCLGLAWLEKSSTVKSHTVKSP